MAADDHHSHRQVWRRDILPPRAWRRHALAAAMITTIAAELAYLFSGLHAAQLVAHWSLPALLVLAAPAIRMREAYLLSLVLVLAALLVWTGAQPAATFARAFDQAAFLVTFILTIGLLREAAATSPAVLECGTFMTRQPSGRRYIAVQLGGNFIGALINLGALSLLAPLIQRGVRQEKGKGASHYVVTRVRERRQLAALSRGFAWSLAWSPATVTLAILPTLIPGIRLAELVAAGLGIATVMLALGWLEDRVRFAPLRRLLAGRGWLPEASQAPFPMRAFLYFGLVCAGLIALTALFRVLGSVDTVPALMLAAPVMLAVWVAAQNWHAGTAAAAAVARRLGHIGDHAVPRAAPEAISLGASGFIGTAAAALIPLDALARAVGLDVMPEWAFLLALPVLMLAVGQVGTSPVIMVILLGNLIGALPALPANATLIGVALTSGGALATTASPFASGTLVLSRATGHAATAIAWRWNLPFAVAAIAVLAALFPLLTGGR